jgi:O-antigen/teichoic acid export membrane protein
MIIIKKINNHFFVRRKFLIDNFWAIFSSFISVGTLQFLVYPFLSTKVSIEEFGIILTSMSLISIIAAFFGSELAYTRLRRNKDYESLLISGDFNFLIIVFLLFSSFLVFIISTFFLQNEFSITFFLILITMINVLKSYYSVYFQINTLFHRVFITNLFVGFGFLIGGFLFSLGSSWFFIFLISDIVSFLYIIYNNKLLREKITVTRFFNDTLRIYFILSFSSLFSLLATNLDKIIIFPIIGLDSVAIISISTLIGKSSSLVLYPVGNVFLSYLLNQKKKISTNNFVLVNVIFISFFLLALVFIYLFANQITMFFYPNFFPLAISYIFVGNVGSLLSVLANIMKSFLLKTSRIKWQFYISLAYFVIYISSGIFLTLSFGIIGFIIATIMSNIVKILLVLIVGLVNLSKPAQLIDFKVGL